jgi:hypothetical protein
MISNNKTTKKYYAKKPFIGLTAILSFMLMAFGIGTSAGWVALFATQHIT